MLTRARWGTALTFVLAGVLCGVWTVRIPALADRFGLRPGHVGVTVLVWGLGALVAMQATRGLLHRLGSRAVLRWAAPLTALSLVGVAAAPTYGALLAAVAGFGMVFGLLDVGMNAQAATVERAAGRPLMNGMHAGWSVGALTGGLIGAGTAAVGLSFAQALVLAGVVGLPAALVLGTTYLPDGAPSAAVGGRPRLPRAVYLVGALAFAGFLVEGSIADWSGLYLHRELGVTEAVAALGYPVFQLGMILGRTVGDRVRARLGTRRLLTVAAAATASTVLVLVIAPGVLVGLPTFLALGLTVCTVVPVTMSLAGTVGGDSSAAAVAQASALGYTGLLLGPVVLGFVADHSSIRASFLVVVALALAIAISVRRSPAVEPARSTSEAQPAPERELIAA